jgi:hypothetical protein
MTNIPQDVVDDAKEAGFDEFKIDIDRYGLVIDGKDVTFKLVRFSQLQAARQSSQSEPVATAWKFRTRFKLDGDWFKWGNWNLTESWEIVQGLLDYAQQKQDYQIEFVSFVEATLAAPQQAIPSEDLRIYIEHGFVCVRTETGQLLASRKVDDFKPYEFITLSASPTAPIESEK